MARIREAKLQDFERIMSLINSNADTFSEHEISEAEKDIRRIIHETDKKHKFFVTTISDKITGCAGFLKREDTDGVYFLCWLAVHPEHKRRGIATKLYCRIEEYIKKMGGRLIILNAGSGEINQYFYKKMDFREGGRIPKYYTESKDLIWYYKFT